MFEGVGRALVLDGDVGDLPRRPVEELAVVGNDHFVVHRGDDGIGGSRNRVADGVELLHESRPRLLVCAGGTAHAGVVGIRDSARLRDDHTFGAVVGGCDPDELMDILGAAEKAHVVAGHHAALAVAHQIHLLGAGGGTHLVHERRELLRRIGDRRGGIHAVGLAVVEGEDAVPGALEVRREGGPVLVHALKGSRHQDDRIRMLGAWFAGPVIGTRRGKLNSSRMGGSHGQGAGQDGSGSGGQDFGEQRHGNLFVRVSAGCGPAVIPVLRVSQGCPDTQQ